MSPTCPDRLAAVPPTAYDIDERRAKACGARRQGHELRMPCPVHDSSPDTLALGRGRDTAVWHCHAGCDPDAVRDALLEAGVLVRTERADYRPPPPRDAVRVPAWILPAWRAARPLHGTPAADYLRSRGLGPPWPPALRWDPDRRRMLAAVVRDDVLLGLHATRLPDKERTFHGPVKGGAVRLDPPGPVLAFAEGIETALAYRAMARVPTWSALSAEGLKAAPIPRGTERVVVAADFDGPGLVAAEALARRARASGVRETDIDVPSRYRSDWADVLAAAR